MNESASRMKNTFAAMVAMFVVAVGMFIGTISIFTSAYNQASADAEKRLQKPEMPTKPGEKEQAKPDQMGEATAKATSNPWFWWTLLNTVVLAALGVFFLFRKPTTATAEEQEAEDKQWGKLGLFAMLSFVGFLTVACIAIPLTWLHSGKLLSRQGWSTTADEPWLPWLIVLSYVLGLGSMFGSLLAVKSEERTNAALRRWIYGYNAFLGALLFLAIIGVLNAFIALYGPEPSDWTSTNIYSLSPATKKLVKSLDKPVKAYVIMRQGYLQADVMGTLNNCKSMTTQLEVTELPLSQGNVKEIDALIKKYEVLRDATGYAEGVLLVQDPSSDKPLATFLKQDDLEEVVGGGMGGGGGQRYYKGEQAIYSALREFRQEKKKVTIYFTQDSGEMSINDGAAGGRRDAPPSRSIVGLKRRLEKAGYVVKPLNLSESEVGGKEPAKVPDDALLVVVADPLRMTSEKAAILDAYMKRPKKEGVEPGKLIALFDPHYGQDNKVMLTGMESVLGGFGVQVGKDVIYAIQSNDFSRDPTEVLVRMVADLPADDEIIESIIGIVRNSPVDLVFRECRSIKTIPAVQSYDVKPLLFAYTPVTLPIQGTRRLALWTEDSNIPKPADYVKNLVKTPEFMKKDLAQLPPSVVVTVRERGAAPPPTNPMMPPAGKLGTPRMVVFGDASFVADSEMQSGGELGANMILTSLAWCRGKPELDSGDVQAKERRAYRLNMSAETLNRVIWLPPLWLLLAVILMGVGVAVLRRR